MNKQNDNIDKNISDYKPAIFWKDKDVVRHQFKHWTLESIEKLNYIALPILAKFYAAPGFSLEAGPQAAFLVSAKNETTASFEGDTETETEDIAEFISTFDLAFALGAAYELENGLFFSARYNLGISNIVADAGGSGYSNQNSVIQLSAGFMFN